MRKVVEVVTVFYSTTSDPNAKERLETVSRVAKSIETTLSVAIRVVYWESSIPGGVAGKSGQARINEEMNGAYDIYFGCLAYKAGQGTLSEFRKAIEGHLRSGDPKEVLFGFDETPVNPFSVDKDIEKVKTFRQQIQSEKEFGSAILYFTFESQRDLEEKLLRDLSSAVVKIKSRFKGGAPRLK